MRYPNKDLGPVEVSSIHVLFTPCVLGMVYTDHCLWSSCKAVFLQYLNEGEFGIQQSKPEANTVAWSPAKWHVS